jgi:catechol 2,3-dioxygenase-like lactoylglutathione lyase family enzyme
MTVQRMDTVGIVVDDLSATIAFFRELGLELEGRGMVEGEWAGRVTGLGDQRVEIAMTRAWRTPAAGCTGARRRRDPDREPRPRPKALAIGAGPPLGGQRVIVTATGGL